MPRAITSARTAQQDVPPPSPPPPGWRWTGRPLDLYALIVIVLAPGELATVFAGKTGAEVQLIRSIPILFIALIVTVLAVVWPEALQGQRPKGATGARNRKSTKPADDHVASQNRQD
jgi:hypothetical protein